MNSRFLMPFLLRANCKAIDIKKMKKTRKRKKICLFFLYHIIWAGSDFMEYACYLTKKKFYFYMIFLMSFVLNFSITWALHLDALCLHTSVLSSIIFCWAIWQFWQPHFSPVSVVMALVKLSSKNYWSK